MSDSIAPSAHHGGCHCGALRWEFVSKRALASLTPRACDCDFCTRHGAAWVSDPASALRVVASAAQLQRYRQGSNQAEFLLCRDCGVLVAVVAHGGDGRLLGAANANACDVRTEFGETTTVSPQVLAPAMKLERWTRVWMPVDLEVADPRSGTSHDPGT